jgi:geranylgeranyl diphosphate synthase type II
MGMISNVTAPSDTKLKLVTEFAKAAGAEGMVGGQVADMEGENKELSLEELEYIHIHKTGKLLGFSVQAGALLAGASEQHLENLRGFAYHLGLAFQIQDDILDLEGNPDLIGKPVGSDTSNHKSTYPQLLTIEGAKKALRHHIDESKYFLERTGLNTTLLLELTDLVASRDH